MCMKTLVVVLLPLDLTSSLEKVTVLYSCFSITEIDDLDAIVPAVKKLKILSY